MEYRRLRRIMRNYRKHKSLLSLRVCRVSFKNLTKCPVSLYWIDYNGRKKLYGSLNPVKRRDSGYTVNTFVTHPWIAEDKETKENMRVNFKRVFYPPEPQQIIPICERAGMWKYMHLKNKEGLGSDEHCIERIDNLQQQEEIESETAEQNPSAATEAYEVLITKSVFSLELIASLAICQLVSKEKLVHLPLPDILKRTLCSTYDKWF